MGGGGRLGRRVGGCGVAKLPAPSRRAAPPGERPACGMTWSPFGGPGPGDAGVAPGPSHKCRSTSVPLATARTCLRLVGWSGLGSTPPRADLAGPLGQCAGGQGTAVSGCAAAPRSRAGGTRPRRQARPRRPRTHPKHSPLRSGLTNLSHLTGDRLCPGRRILSHPGNFGVSHFVPTGRVIKYLTKMQFFGVPGGPPSGGPRDPYCGGVPPYRGVPPLGALRTPRSYSFPTSGGPQRGPQ